jgi:hypothetical protein
VREAIVNTDGSINRDTVFSMSSDIPLLGKGIPGTEGRGVRSVLEDSLASKLRLETGAQANKEELQNIVDRFMPSLLDDDATIRDKMERLNQFFTDALHNRSGLSQDADRSRGRSWQYPGAASERGRRGVPGFRCVVWCGGVQAA